MVVHQVWQADDMVLFSRSKRDARVAMRSLERYLSEHLGLQLKPWKVCLIGEDEPVDICGAVIRPSHTEVRSGTFLRGRRAIRAYDRRPTIEGARRVCSYHGIFSSADCEGFMRREGAHAIAKRAARDVSRHDRGIP